MTWASIIIIGLIKIKMIIFIIVVKVIMMTIIIITNRKPFFCLSAYVRPSRSSLVLLPSPLPQDQFPQCIGKFSAPTYLLALIRASSVSTWQRGSG